MLYRQVRRRMRIRRAITLTILTITTAALALTGVRAFASWGWPFRDDRVVAPRVPEAPPTTRPEPTAEPTREPRVLPTTLRPGDAGPLVVELQRRLDDLGYRIDSIDGSFGPATQHAVMALQKIHGLTADGVVGGATRRALAAPRPVEPRDGSAGFHVEVDLARQVLFVVEDGTVAEIVDVSTGSGETYWQDGREQLAATPPGRFEITWRYDGWRHADLGTLYRPAYFNGGIAIHGSPEVPAYPASHGCVRVTNWVMDRLFDRLVEGTPVLVY